MKAIILAIIASIIFISCNKKDSTGENKKRQNQIEIGGDFSIMKKMTDNRGVYKINEVQKPGFEIFKNNGYTWARLRIFYSPNMVGPVCNNLDYTIQLAKEAKQFGFNLFLDFHYSDTWADPGKQFTPAAWENLKLTELADSVYRYSKRTLNAMSNADVEPSIVQIGNEINNGMLWPVGKLWVNGNAQWDNLATLLKAGIKGVKEAQNVSEIKIMIQAATGGNREETDNFYKNLISHGVEFDIIGLSYYPWWHGTFDQLEDNLTFLSANYKQEISLVETAYYANNWYPKKNNSSFYAQPYPPTEQGQYDFMIDLLNRLKKYPKVTSLFYWKPDGIDVPSSGVNYIGRSLFDKKGNALKGISAWN